jgi:hypothetical protein
VFIFSIGEYIEVACPCDSDWKNAGQYPSCVAHVAGDLVDRLTEAEKDAIVSESARN